MLAPIFGNGRMPTSTEENIQSRMRGVILMAVSNKFGSMVLTTGNKSEMAVGYATLYGDMNGGYNPLKDIYKTEVFGSAAGATPTPATAWGPQARSFRSGSSPRRRRPNCDRTRRDRTPCRPIRCSTPS